MNLPANSTEKAHLRQREYTIGIRINENIQKKSPCLQTQTGGIFFLQISIF